MSMEGISLLSDLCAWTTQSSDKRMRRETTLMSRDGS